MTTTREIQITGQGFTAEFSAWADEFVDSYDWAAIREAYNTQLDALAPDGVTWGWSESGPYCHAEISVDPAAVRQEWIEAVGGMDTTGTWWDPSIDFEAIATANELHEAGAE